MTLFVAIILLVFIFGFLVFIHETGHFIAAKLNGVWVKEYAFGFGPKIIGKKFGETEYKVNLIPLGGYVLMHGDEDAASFKQDQKLKDDPRSYVSKKIWQKMTIVLAGVFANILTAFVIFYLYLIIVGFKPEPILNITNFDFKGAVQNEYLFYYSLDENSVLKEYEVPETGFLVSINDDEIGTREQLQSILNENIGKEVSVEILGIDLDKHNYTVEVPAPGIDNDAKLGIYPLSSAYVPYWDEGDETHPYYWVDEEREDTPAIKSDLPEEGYIISVNDQVISDTDELTDVLSGLANEIVSVLVDTNTGERESFTVELGEKDDNGKVKMGVFVADEIASAVDSPEFFIIDYSDNKVFSGIAHTYNITLYQAKGLGVIIKRAFEGDSEQLSQSIATPIKIGEVVYDLVSINDFNNIINLSGLVSATLAFMNMLPIPMIDGGQFVLLLIEKVRGKPLPEKWQDILGKLGFGFIVILGVVALLKDFWQVILSRIF